MTSKTKLFAILLMASTGLLSACNGADRGANTGTGTGPTNPDNETDMRQAGKARTRYAMANDCWALRANGNQQYLVGDSTGYSASAATIAEATPFYMKPTGLGKYLLYTTSRQVLNATGSAISQTGSASATDDAEWEIKGLDDLTNYPPTPQYNVEPTPEEVAAYHDFVDPNTAFLNFTAFAPSQQRFLTIDSAGALTTAQNSDDNSSFSFEPASGCSNFPEAQSNFSGKPFSGTQSNGSVLGHADVHVHISASEFLGGAQHGRPYHKFGVEHALQNCDVTHGQNGFGDAVGGLFGSDFDGHDTSGYPDFVEWPARSMLTHEAIYWKWLERSWAAGLRVVVNDVVDNETLCELQRSLSGDPLRQCNSMTNAGRQVGTMYGMQDYIDAQYGGRGKGFFQIVHDVDDAREVIAEGNMAVVLGIEISNLFDCKVQYSPLRQQRPENEDGSGGIENSYGCTTEEGLPNSIDTQMKRAWDWGVRQLITIHEFDNAFGGNGIFDGLVLNLGNRENSGAVPSGDLERATNILTNGGDISGVVDLVTNPTSLETPTGEWWTTYDCPIEDETEGFSGYLWGNSGGSTQSYLSQPLCVAVGQDGRSGGALPCYPADVRQCNARWMTPAGLYTYGKIMEYGFILDWDHMEMGMKTQLLELSEAQATPYPIVSTHGTFGGTTIDQATRLLKGGGILYPSNGSSRGFRTDMDETYGIWEQAMADVPEDQRQLFGFGYGTDTNGLSSQTGPRGDIEPGNELTYPFTLFAGEPWDGMAEFSSAAGVVFEQPNSLDVEGNVRRTWHQDIDGNAHHGMLSDFVQEIRIEGQPDNLRHLFNAAEVFLRTWEQTEVSSQTIQAEGLQMPNAPILRPAPPIGDIAP